MPDRPSVTFADAEMYIIRDAQNWANVVIDEDTGTFVSIGSEGFFGACWPSVPEESLKQTLRDLSFDRFCERCGCGAAEPRAAAFWDRIWPHVISAINWDGAHAEH